MHLIEALAAGIAGAEDGSVKLYVRGTSTRATWYADFEAEGSGSTADIPLDAYGAAVVYVDQLVRVDVYSGSTLRRSFVAGSGSTAVEVRSLAVSGTDYETAETGAGLPTTVKRFIDAWLTTSGSALWPNVNPFATGAMTLAAALGASTVFFNVKTFGAIGDGVTNDTAAIQSALTAADNNGGGTLYFPPGDYKITAALTVPSSVSLLGSSANGSAIVMGTAGVIAINYASSLGTGLDGPAISIASLNIYASVTTTAAMVHLNGGAFLLHACTFGSENSTTNVVTAGTALTHISALGCSFEIAAGSGSCFRSTSSAATVLFAGTSCRFYVGTGAYTGRVIKSQRTMLCNCNIIMDSTSGTCYAVEGIMDSAPRTYIHATGCEFEAGAGATLTAFLIAESGTARLVESANGFFGTTPYSITQSVADMGGGHFSLGGRLGRVLNVTNNTAGAQAVDALNYDTVIWQRTNNGTQTPTLAICPPGNRFSLLWWNNHALTGGTITLASASGALLSEFASDQFTVAAESVMLTGWKSFVVGANYRWIQDGESTGDEAE